MYALHWLSVVVPSDQGPDFVVEASQDEAHWHTIAEAESGGRTSLKASMRSDGRVERVIEEESQRLHLDPALIARISEAITAF